MLCHVRLDVTAALHYIVLRNIDKGDLLFDDYYVPIAFSNNETTY